MKTTCGKEYKGADLQPQHKENCEKNTNTLNSKKFIAACGKVEITPTRRQASKFRRKTGLAYTG